MRKLTLKERFIRMLTAMGYNEVESRSYKRDVYTNGEKWYFLSDRGVRVNKRNDKVTESVSVTLSFKRLLIEWEKR